MDQLQVVENNQLTLTSLEISEMLNKRHSDLLRTIEEYVFVLENAKLRSQNFFKESSYKVEGNNKTYKQYLLTRKGCDMVANKMTGEKGILFTATYIERFHQMEQELKIKQAHLTTNPFNQIQLIAIGTTQLNERVEKLEVFFDERLTVDYGQQQAIRNALNRRVYKLWDDGTINQVVHDSRKKLFSAAWRDVKSAFAVNSYCNILQKDFNEAISYINAWRPRLV
ncbi:Rha family transcriptional regulator [Bacillus thuringiensis]|uniref:Rha family transcriptional regulator n=1 Tax=Bacillus thuringiensis TaxID=1428 RepID=A0A9W3TB06_BACTU|nr:Rha family transcriptional regulator [Bacillus thuringiensis]AQY37867.1 Rha family transcriptional regulator [Bacillus thuringiensis]MDR4149653.1 Rha family transcriptional regulator [Bacillus thuringiensis]MEC3573682.1 Rha family transcriptional regulator [Bacillus thuringiensis]MED2021827.1 Rha family transcriptional regulator [Bacillus thuringiensis]MED2140254.1 Rha family transcriptional regulator [Bacillus thuringiensis]